MAQSVGGIGIGVGDVCASPGLLHEEEYGRFA